MTRNTNGAFKRCDYDPPCTSYCMGSCDEVDNGSVSLPAGRLAGPDDQ